LAGCYPRLVETLARAAAHGHLPITHVHAALAVNIARGVRLGTLPGNGTVEERLHIYRHILGLHLDAFAAAEDRATGAIGRALRPLIGIGAPRNRLLAEAHNANEDHGRPLSERQVEDVAKTQVYWAIQRGRRHAG
jgi:hypothetical protein